MTSLNFSVSADCQKVVNILQRHGVGNWRFAGGTDKEQLASGEDGSSHHSYGVVYQAIADKLANLGVAGAVLEIGVQYGGSLLLWQGLFEERMIIGIDTWDQMHEKVHKALDWDRVRYWRMDGYRADAIEKVRVECVDGIALAVDDGPHTLSTQLAFIRDYVPLLADGGIAVVEDVQTTDCMAKLVDAVPAGYLYEIIDRRNVNGRIDDLMLVIESPLAGVQ